MLCWRFPALYNIGSHLPFTTIALYCIKTGFRQHTHRPFLEQGRVTRNETWITSEPQDHENDKQHWNQHFSKPTNTSTHTLTHTCTQSRAGTNVWALRPRVTLCIVLGTTLVEKTWLISFLSFCFTQ